MAKKIVILASSPRKNGNTNTIVKWVAEAAEQEGAVVEIIDIAHLSYKTNGCTACMGCQQSSEFKCVIDDEASPLIASIAQYDVVVIASPIYYMGINAQAKLFLDRMFSLFKFNPQTGEIIHAAGKRQTHALIATCGGGIDDSGIKLAEETCKAGAEFSGSPFVSLLLANTPMEPGAIVKDEAAKEKAQVFGKKLALG